MLNRKIHKIKVLFVPFILQANFIFDKIYRQNDKIAEWTLKTPDKMRKSLPKMVSLLQTKEYAFPTVMPDGTYEL